MPWNGLHGVTAVDTRHRKNSVLRKVVTNPMTESKWAVSNTIYQTVVAFIHMQAIVTAGVLGVNIAGIVPVVRARTE